MSWLFGKKKKKKEAPPPPNVNETKEKLDKQIEFIDMSKKKYEKQIDDVKEQAKAALKKKDQKKAKLMIQRKKMYEAEISKLDGMQLMMEQQKISMESTMNNKNVFDTMEQGANTIDQLTKEADIDKFDEIREKHEEMKERNEEINDFFANFAEDQDIDWEDDLAELEAELAEDEMDDVIDKPITGGSSKISNKAEKSKREEEDLLAELN